MAKPNHEFDPDISAWLNDKAKRPLGVAVSGGGDSVALLHYLRRGLAQSQGRDLIVYHFDHGLQSASRGWADRVRSLSLDLKCQFRMARWQDPPLAPKPDLIRQARHLALARLMEEDGVHSLCLGHTHDDNRESALMRCLGSNIGQMSVMSIHPLWPEGRGKCLYRPLIGRGRAELRHYLKKHNLEYIDDPANEVGLRGAARQQLARGGDQAELLEGIQRCQAAPSGYHMDVDQADDRLSLSKSWLNGLEERSKLRVMKVAVVVMGEGERLASETQIIRLLSLKGSASLCGARITAKDDGFLIRADRQDKRLKPRRSWPPFFNSLYPQVPTHIWKQWRFEAALGVYGSENEALSLI